MASHSFYMLQCLELAKMAQAAGDVPVGALIVDRQNGEIIGRGYNRREQNQDATAHAEILAIREACAVKKSWRLTDCLLYVTLEPCPMCCGAILLARLPLVVFGAGDSKQGACGSIFNLPNSSVNSGGTQFLAGICEEECQKLLTDFFSTRRGTKA